ncbi:MAG: sigma-70 family RNA polymerase sigma factor, partial [Nocardioides sp.]
MLQQVHEVGDAELISAVRGGDLDAYGELFSRHVDAARRLARQLVSPSDADDLVSDAFAKVLAVLQRGGGPDLAFRAYLLTAVRRLHVDRIRATSRLHSTDDMEPFDPGVPFRDTAVEGFENAAAARAFASLPERWQMVLWHTEVEEQKPAEVAALLGMSANSVSALAYRAREGLRQAFLTMHAQELEDDACAWTHQNLGAYVRNGISRRDAAKVEAHLSECRPCTAVYLELTEVNSNLSGILAPLLLGGVAAAYVGSASGVAAHGGLLLVLDRVRDFVVANAPASAAAGLAVTVVAGGAVFVVLDEERDEPRERAPSAVGDAPERDPRQRPQSEGRDDQEAVERRVVRGDARSEPTSPPDPAPPVVEPLVAQPGQAVPPPPPAEDEPRPGSGPQGGGGP